MYAHYIIQDLCMMYWHFPYKITEQKRSEHSLRLCTWENVLFNISNKHRMSHQSRLSKSNIHESEINTFINILTVDCNNSTCFVYDSSSFLFADFAVRKTRRYHTLCIQHWMRIALPLSGAKSFKSVSTEEGPLRGKFS